MSTYRAKSGMSSSCCSKSKNKKILNSFNLKLSNLAYRAQQACDISYIGNDENNSPYIDKELMCKSSKSVRAKRALSQLRKQITSEQGNGFTNNKKLFNSCEMGFFDSQEEAEQYLKTSHVQFNNTRANIRRHILNKGIAKKNNKMPQRQNPEKGLYGSVDVGRSFNSTNKDPSTPQPQAQLNFSMFLTQNQSKVSNFSDSKDSSIVYQLKPRVRRMSSFTAPLKEMIVQQATVQDRLLVLTKQKSINKKMTFDEFILQLYQQKMKDLKKTIHDKKQKLLFKEACAKKFTLYAEHQIQRLAERHNIPMPKQTRKFIKQIDLSHCDLGSLSICCLGQYLINNQKVIKPIRMKGFIRNKGFCLVSELILDRNPIGDQGVDLLAKVLKEGILDYLKTLSLINVNVSPKGGSALLKSLIGHKFLKSLHLSSIEGVYRNRIGNSFEQMQYIFSHPSFGWQTAKLDYLSFPRQSLNSLSKGIQTRACLIPLKILSLRGNQIQPAQFQIFIKKLQNVNHLQELNLADNNIRDEGILLLSEILGRKYAQNGLSKNLTKLDVSQNHIKSIGMEVFSKEMTNNKVLQQLILRGNLFSEGNRFHAFRFFINKNWTIKKLDLSNCFTDHQDLRHLFEGMQQNCVCEVLTVSDNFISKETFKCMSVMLSVNKALKHLQLDNCNIGDNYILECQQQLKRIKTLQTWSMSKNFLTDKVSYVLLEIIIKRKSLTSINLSKNSFGSHQMKQIQQALAQNKSRVQNSSVDLQKNLEYLTHISNIQTEYEDRVKQSINNFSEKKKQIQATKTLCDIIKSQNEEARKKQIIDQELRVIRILQRMVPVPQLEDDEELQNNSDDSEIDSDDS